MQNKQVLGHPAGLFFLFFTELWERFSFYGMRAILVLFLTASAHGANPGMGRSETEALKIYGIYSLLVYISSIPGGIIADKWLGQKKCVIAGGILLVIGHSILAVQHSWAFFTGLAFIIMGVGGLKANISGMVGALYKKNDGRRDKGFSIFYIGINIGAFTSALVVGYIGEAYGWHYGFAVAGIGMVIGLLTFIAGQRYLIGIGDPVNRKEKDVTEPRAPLSKAEKDRIIAILIACLLIIIFWGAYEQAGGLMNLYAEQKTNRLISFLKFTVPASWFQSVTAFFIITLGIPVAWFWHKRGIRKKETSSLFKITWGMMIMGWGFLFMVCASRQLAATGSSAMYWLVLTYLFNTIGELCASPVALSYITKLSPARYSSIMMGVYFAATGLGNYLAGWVGIWAQKAGETEIFIGIALFCTLLACVIFIFLKPLKRLSHGVEETVGGNGLTYAPIEPVY